MNWGKPVVAVGVLVAWALWMRATGASEKTIRTRVEGIRSLCAHAGGKDPVMLTTMDVVAWLAGCRSQWTRKTYATSARQWHRWLVEQGMRGDDPTAKIPVIKKPDAAARPAPTIAIEDVLEHSGRRTRAYISLATFQGLRCFEIAKIRGEDFVDDWLMVTGKGGQPAAVPVHPLVELLRRGWPAEGYWFPGTQDGHVRPEAVSHTVAKAFHRHGYPVTAHMLRHWYGTWVQRTGKDVRATQELMRHKSLGSTQMYTKVSSLAKVEIVRRLRVEGSMKRFSVMILAVVLLLAGCAAGTAAPAPTITVTVTPTVTPAAGLRAAVYAYSAAFLRGDGGTAYGLLSQRCRDRMTRSDFVVTARLAKELYGPQPIATYVEHVAGDLARVTYTYAMGEIDQRGEPWVRESGAWRQDDCSGM